MTDLLMMIAGHGSGPAVCLSIGGGGRPADGAAGGNGRRPELRVSGTPGKLAVARDRGVPVPAGTILDRAGNPTTAPEDYFNGGMLLPAGGHKGTGLALLVDVLGGILTGAGCPSCEQSTPINGVLFLMLNPGFFRAQDAIDRDLASLLRAIKATPPAAGVDEVLVPGEPEQRNQAGRPAPA